MAKLNKKNVDIANKLLEDLPVELCDIILLKTFDKLAKRCYEDPEYLNICSKDKERICKQILIDAKYDIDESKWVGKYKYLVDNLIKIAELISKTDNTKVKIDNKTQIVNYVNGPRIFELSESEYKKIPEDVINFALKNVKGIKDDADVYKEGGKLYTAFQKKKSNELFKLLKKHYVPIGVKNDLVRLAIQRYNREPNTNTMMDTLTNGNMILIEQLAQYGASKYVMLDEFKRQGNMVFFNMYNSAPRTLLGRVETMGLVQ